MLLKNKIITQYPNSITIESCVSCKHSSFVIVSVHRDMLVCEFDDPKCAVSGDEICDLYERKKNESI